MLFVMLRVKGFVPVKEGGRELMMLEVTGIVVRETKAHHDLLDDIF
jgi:hypothetical protein